MKALSKTTFVFAASLILAIAAHATGDGWLTSYDQALKEAKKTGKPLLVDFTGSDWCTWCVKLHSEVFSKPEFKKWAHNKVVLLELDFPHSTPQPDTLRQQNERLERKYHGYVEGFPTVLFMRTDGTIFGKYGYDRGGPKKWTEKADRLFAYLATSVGKQGLR